MMINKNIVIILLYVTDLPLPILRCLIYIS